MLVIWKETNAYKTNGISKAKITKKSYHTALVMEVMSHCSSDGGRTLSHSCLKVHGGVPIVLCIFLDPLVLRINCLVSRE